MDPQMHPRNFLQVLFTDAVKIGTRQVRSKFELFEIDRLGSNCDLLADRVQILICAAFDS